MIPDEAVEAAAEQLWPGGTKEAHRLRNLRAALEAAAPHLMRDAQEQAWANGYTSGHSRAMRMMSDEPNVTSAKNPYRKPADV